MEEKNQVLPAATSPYNFIPASNKIVGAPEDTDKLFSGTIKCKLNALSPIFIGGASDNQSESSNTATDHYFLKVNNEYIIPGSSIKGMIRNIVETISCSSMSNVSKDKIFYRRVNTNKKDDMYKRNYPPVDRDTRKPEYYQGGFLKRNNEGKYILEIAKVEQVSQSTNSEDILTTGPLPGNKEGKCNYYSFTRIHNARILDVDEEVFNDFRAQMKNVELQKSNWKAQKTDLSNGKGVKVFYTLDKNTRKINAIGFCVYFRRAYKNTAADLIKTNINDFSNSLFGRIDDSCKDTSESAIKGRVAFLNGKFTSYPIPESDFEFYLSSPHTTCVKLYLQQKNEGTYIDYNSDDAKLRGRKFYWNRKPVDRKPTSVDECTVILHPLAANSKAEFSIVIDKISFIELGAIIEALKITSSFKEKDGNQHCLRIGGGKPYGLGAVEIQIDYDRTKVQNVKDRYSSLKERIENNVKNLTTADLEDARKAFREFILDKTGTEFEKQPFYEPLRVMTDFTNPPPKNKTEYMALGDFLNRGALQTALEIKRT